MPPRPELRLPDRTVDLVRGEITDAEGQRTPLTDKERELIAYFAAHPGRVLGRAELYREVWGYRTPPNSRTLDVTLRRLRTKIEVNPAAPLHIQTVPGVGYRMDLPAEAPGGGMARDPTGFVGRRGELVRLEHEVERPGVIAVIGPPGMGKTRLLREAVRTRQGECCFVDLAAADDVDALIAEVARQIGVPLVRDQGVPEAVARVGRALAARGDLVLILDNLDAVVEAALPIVAAWSQAAPRARVALTSRVWAALPGARVLDLGPLPPGEARDLFVARARSARHDFQPTAEDVDAIDEIALHLDRIPLALELAAARVAVLTPAQVLDRLGRRFQLLSASAARATAKRVSLWDAIKWSWELLRPGEQRALARFSSFVGGFTEEAAQALLEPCDEDPPLLLGTLLAASLCRREGARFLLYESVRAFAWQQLGEDAAPTVHRHARWCVARCEELWMHPGQNRSAIHEEQANLEVARERMLEADPVLAARATAVLGRSYLSEGPLHRYLPMLDALEPIHDLPVALRRRLLQLRADTCRVRGQLDLARAAVDAALDCRGPDSETAEIIGLKATLDLDQGRLAEADAGYSESLDLPGADLAYTGRALGNLGLVRLQLGRLDEARSLFDRALVIHQQVGNRRYEGLVRTYQGILAMERGSLGDAEAAFEAGCAVLRAEGAVRFESQVLGNLGSVLLEVGKLDEARVAFQRAQDLLARIGDHQFDAVVVGNLGVLELIEGRPGPAEDLLRVALEMVRTIDDVRVEGYFLAWLAGIEASTGRPGAARLGLDRAETLLERVGDTAGLAFVAVQEGQLALARGDRQAARAVLERAGEGAPGTRARDRSQEVRLALGVLQEALSAGGE